MAIDDKEINIGSYYLAGEQLRKVTSITQDEEGRDRINYDSKSVNIPNREFWGAATKANPALRATFTEAVDKILSEEEIQELRNKNIILDGE